MTLADDLREIFAASGVDEATSDLVSAALDGPEALESVLSGNPYVDLESESVSESGRPTARAYLSAIEVTGFRGIGQTSRLDVNPGPGLTVVAGRNGSGKSSFAEGLEVVLTGDSWRWRNRSAEWRQGWRNLHTMGRSGVSAEFMVEGRQGLTRVSREWDENSRAASDGETIVQADMAKRTTIVEFGWANAIDLYRPLLSHAELGAVADSPSALFDALSAALGLDELTAAADVLRKRRLELEASLKKAKKDLSDGILPQLRSLDDERGTEADLALSGKKWDLDRVEGLVAGPVEPGSDVANLREIMGIPGLDLAKVEAVAAEMDSALAEVRRLEGTDAGRSRRLASILELAVAEHELHGDGDCPVCGKGFLDTSWRDQANAEKLRLTEEATEYDRALTESNRAMTNARRLTQQGVPDLSVLGPEATAFYRTIEAWQAIPEDLAQLSSHLRSHGPDVGKAIETISTTARALLSEREDLWRPAAMSLAAWVELARSGQADNALAKQVGAAEKALAAAIDEIRALRFEPIATQAKALWAALRLESNVNLEAVALSGKGTQRRVDLTVTVDDTSGPALGVVSQGEVNCLALSLFFPRAMLPESPFGFIVIDDPVQAMDPSRVDGLARVFSDVAKDRQLIVFTHDDRLPEALRRLQLAHTLLQVTRRPGSVVQVRSSLDPVEQYFLDARAVAKDEELPDVVASRVVPGFCRNGIEAACMTAVRRRRLGRGDTHAAVEHALADRKAAELAAMALFDDDTQGGRVLGEINRKWGKTAGDAFRDCQRGAHQGFSGSLLDLVNEAQGLAARLRQVS
jgi:recombinational DNA repair ATPase RecF